MALQKYDRIGTLSLDEVFPHIKKHFNEQVKRRVKIKEFFVNVQSLRLRTFLKKGTKCPCCGVTANFFAIERTQGNQGGFHLNLYGINSHNEEVLFTHDHIIARSHGGEDNIENSRTMCGPCNWKKGKIESLLLKSIPEEEKNILRKELTQYLP